MVACFGDVAPVTTPRLATPAGFKVMQVDMRSGAVVDFAVNRIAGPASKLPRAGFERPSHCAFGPDGALYVVDWGEIEIAPEVGGLRMKQGTGMLWRIRRTAGPRGERPLPLYAVQALAMLAAMLGLATICAWLIRRRQRSKEG